MGRGHWVETTLCEIAEVFLGTTPGKDDYCSTGPKNNQIQRHR